MERHIMVRGNTVRIPGVKELKAMVGAKSWDYEDVLVLRGLDPKKLRADFGTLAKGCDIGLPLENVRFDSMSVEVSTIVTRRIQNLIDVQVRKLGGNPDKVFIGMYECVDTTDEWSEPGFYSSKETMTKFVAVYEKEEELRGFAVEQRIEIDDYTAVDTADSFGDADVLDEPLNMYELLTKYPKFLYNLLEIFDAKLIIKSIKE